MVGVMEWVQHEYLFQLLLAIAGSWGLLSALFIQRNPGSALAFHFLSVHFFLGASVAVLWLRFRQPSTPTQTRSSRAASQTLQELLLLADICFVVGAGMACISSYLTLAYGIEQVALMVDVQRLNVFAAILWVVCSLIYLTLTCRRDW